MFDGDNLVAQARRVQIDLAPPAPPSFVEAQAASKSFSGLQRHLLPQCFVCGPLRAEGDGLRIFPGRTANDAVFAAPWVPHTSLDDGSGRVAPEFLWAALDCAGAFAVMPGEMRPIILGELCARLDRLLREVGNIDAECFLLVQMAILCWTQDKLDAAADKFERSLSLSRELTDQTREAQALTNLGALRHDQGEKQLARTHFESALAVARECGNHSIEAKIRSIVGQLEQTQG